jgi:hypothetical protein
MKAKRKRRLDKKLHKYWLSLGVVDASLVSAWRRKLLDAHEFDEFSIDSDNCDELWSDTRAALKKYQLSYRVARVPNSEAESWTFASSATSTQPIIVLFLMILR